MAKSTRIHRKWSPQELATLQRLYPTTHIKALAELLGRAKGSVSLKAASLGLQRAEGYVREKSGPKRSKPRKVEVMVLPSATDIEFSEWLPRWKATQTNRFNNRAYMRLPVRPELYAVRVI